jgi:uncharacterized protein YqgV (UPF0045/DUF77 family)
MNERIRELLEEAGVKYVTMPKDTVYEKFAELIVAECVKVAMRSVSDDEPKEAWYLIEEHFGVEE